MATVGVSIAAADPTTPTGIGSLIPMPDLAGAGQKSLFEAHGLDFAVVDSQVGVPDFANIGLSMLANFFWTLAVMIAFTAIGAIYWLMNLTGLSQLTDPLAGLIGASSTELMGWLLPSAVVIGLLRSYLVHNGKQAFSSITWVLIAAIVGTSLALFPNRWVDAANTTRTVAADAAASIGTVAVTAPDQKIPFTWDPTTYGETDSPPPGETAGQARQRDRNVLLRKTADATWRGLIAVPWCIVEFGGMEACQRYGPDMIKLPPAERQEYINREMTTQEGSGDAPTVQWVKGQNSGVRVVVALATLAVVVVFLGGIFILGLAVIFALISMLLHLFVGVFFTLTWCIEGRPREIGLRWFESLVGTILQGAIAMLTFSAMLLLTAAVYSNFTASGFLISSGLLIVGIIAAITFRSTVAGWFGLGGRSGSALATVLTARYLGAAALRGARGAVNSARGITGGVASGLGRAGRDVGRGARAGLAADRARTTAASRQWHNNRTATPTARPISDDVAPGPRSRPHAVGVGPAGPAGSPVGGAGRSTPTAPGRRPAGTPRSRTNGGRADTRAPGAARVNGTRPGGRTNGSSPARAAATDATRLPARPGSTAAPASSSGTSSPRPNASRRIAAAEAAKVRPAPPRGAAQPYPTRNPLPRAPRKAAEPTPRAADPRTTDPGGRPRSGAYPSRRIR